MSRKSAALVVLVLVGLTIGVWPQVTAARETRVPLGRSFLSNVACDNMDTEGKIKVLAKLLVATRNQVDEGVRNCYNTLTSKDKARVFEAMAVERGISEELRKETQDHKKRSQENLQNGHPDTGNIRAMAGIPWQQLVEPYGWSTNGRVGWGYVQNNYCDGSDPDVDWDIYHSFSVWVSNPDQLFTQGLDPRVNAMIWYYYWNYGGVNSRGNTQSSTVIIYLGGTGVANAGGPANVTGNMIMWY